MDARGRGKQQVEPLVGLERSGVENHRHCRRETEPASDDPSAAFDRRIARARGVFDEHGARFRHHLLCCLLQMGTDDDRDPRSAD